MTDQAVDGDELAAEVDRLSWRQLTLYDESGDEVFTMTIGPHGCRWTAAGGAEPLQVAKIEIG
jgi:hypothetical protein